jgi:phosphoribosylglycinamide formyltransferase-1
MMTWMSDQSPSASDRAPHAHEIAAVLLSPASHRDGEQTIAVLASGSGTILAALASAGLPIAVVLVDRACGAEKIAVHEGIRVERVERTSFGAGFDRARYTEEVTARLAPYQVDLVAMAGYGTVLGKAIHDAYPGRILNTHPALLPAFKGWHAVEDALAAGASVTGCTVHSVTLEVDAGPILAQQVVPVLPDDTAATLHERIKVAERSLYPETIRRVLKELAAEPGSRPPW